MSPIRDMIGGALSSVGDGFIENNVHEYTLEVASAAVLGGTISEIGGGKFANGAITGAYSFMFNAALHKKTLKVFYIVSAQVSSIDVDEKSMNTPGTGAVGLSSTFIKITTIEDGDNLTVKGDLFNPDSDSKVSITVRLISNSGISEESGFKFTGPYISNLGITPLGEINYSIPSSGSLGLFIRVGYLHVNFLGNRGSGDNYRAIVR